MEMTHIRSKRLEVGIGQSELARRVGTSRQHLTRIENGENVPNVFLAARIAVELESTVEELWPAQKAS